MIIKKPYAFLIKHFRLIHLALSILLMYLVFKTNSIFKFFNDYVKNGYYTYSNNISSKYINGYMFISVVLVILLSLFIYLLMKWKKKSRIFYVSNTIFYFLLFIGLLVYFNAFNNILNTTLDVRTVRAYRDIILILYFPQYLFLIFSVFRAIGFDIKKFDFKRDLEELDIAEEDQEEIEVTFGQNSYKFKRKFRQIFREIKFYALENKFFFAAICGIIFLVTVFIVYTNMSVYGKKYNESEFFNVNGVIFKVMDSYITNFDLSGKVIDKNKQYFVIKTSMENTNTTRVNLSTDSLRLILDEEAYFPIYTKSDLFKDLGEGYYKNTLYSGEKYEYLIIYEIPKDIKYKKALFRMVDNVSLVRGEISAKYKDVKLDPKVSLKNDEPLLFNLGDAISLEDSTLLNSEVLVDSYSIADSFTELYTYCVNTCYTGKKIIEPDLLGKSTRTILKIDLDLDLDNDLFVNKYINSNSDFISLFGSITYIVDGTEKNADKIIKPLDNIDTTSVYLEVPEEIKRASVIKLNLSIRNKTYIITL